MYQRHELGKTGENIVKEYLIKEGYKIVALNFRYKKYEIDIIAKDKEEIVFIEVKTRSSKDYGMPAEAVTKLKQKHILKTAKYYLHIYKMENIYTRFDVIEVYYHKEKYYIHHIKQTI